MWESVGHPVRKTRWTPMWESVGHPVRKNAGHLRGKVLETQLGKTLDTQLEKKRWTPS